MQNPKAAMLVIGDEILSGRTRDANMYHLAGSCTKVGIDLSEVRVVADVHDDIVAALNALRSRYDHVFTSGGIGPTHDDITADAVAAAFGTTIDVRADARSVLARAYPNGEADLTDARLRMARIPKDAALIDNPVSSAPGFSLGNVHVMAGVPKIFEAMLDGLLPRLATGQPVLSETLRVEQPESQVAAVLGQAQARNDGVAIGSYPFSSAQGPGTNVVIRGQDPDQLRKIADQLRLDLGLSTL